MSSIQNLRTYLHCVDPGEVPFGHVSEIERLLRDCWHELEITTDDEKLEPHKLLNRTESLTWKEPFLTFEIERHGATVSGSVYAEVHTWSINVESGHAALESRRRRQVHPKDKRLDVKPLAQEIAALIVDGVKDERLRWKGIERVRVEIGEVIPATNEQTTSGRRRRFRAELCRLLNEHGWVMTGVNRFSRIGGGNSSAKPLLASAAGEEPLAK